MGVFLYFFLISVALPLGQVQSCPDDQCRILAFPSTLFFVGERLVNHTIANISVIDRDACEYRCYLDYNCVSVNFYFGENGAESHNCELSNSTAKEYDKDLMKAANYIYHGTKNVCAQAPCKNYGTCQSGFTRKRYRCLCASGFTGHDCEKDIDECSKNSYNCSYTISTCNNTKGSFKCICKPGFSGDGHNCTDINECANDTHNCSRDNATCRNTAGSFNCSCNSGFTGDGHICQAFHAVFTNLGAKGSHGPTTSNSPYASQDHDRQVTIIDGIQHWTVPYTGHYRIKAIGAAGGCDYDRNSCGGKGAKLIGEFRLNMSEVIQVLVGQEGGSNINAWSSGGGGGTFVVRGNSTPLIIAGGGGGGGPRAKNGYGRCNANTGTTGNAGYTSWPGGSNGTGAHQTASVYSDIGGGGGGFYSSGAGNRDSGGKGFLQGGLGGQVSSSSQMAGFGGFGGGGGGGGWGGRGGWAWSRFGGGGGGGGYSGGSGGRASCGGGGGSYNVGRNQQNNLHNRTSSGHGLVDIMFLGNH